VGEYRPVGKDEEMLVGSLIDRLNAAQRAADARALAAQLEHEATS
jgi:hypothetical protein